MSWSVSFTRPVPKAEVDAAIDALEPRCPLDGPMADQLRIAKVAAKVLATNVPGPYIMVSVNGHANGIGWQEKQGWSNDCINVNVTQIQPSQLSYYGLPAAATTDPEPPPKPATP